MIYFETWNIYLLFKHCCYCFVRWTVYHWIFCKKVNRKYEHNTSCTLNNHWRPYRRTTVFRHLTESSKIITPKCHNHRHPYQRTVVRQHITESSKIITPKCHNHQRPYRRNLSVGKLSVANFTDKNTDGMREFQRVWIECTSDHVRFTDGITDGPRKIWSAIKKFSAKFKNYRRIVYLLPTDLKN